MKIKVTLVDVNGTFVAEVRAPADAGLFGEAASPTPRIVTWRGRGFVRLPKPGGPATPEPRVYREVETYRAAERPVRRAGR